MDYFHSVGWMKGNSMSMWYPTGWCLKGKRVEDGSTHLVPEKVSVWTEVPARTCVFLKRDFVNSRT